MKFTFFVIALTLLIFSCTNSSCPENKVFQQKYEVHLSRVKKCVKSNSNGITNEALRSILYLTEVTGHEPNVSFGDVNYYESKADFRKDHREWKKWYNQNMCTYSNAESERIEQNILQSTDWMEK